MPFSLRKFLGTAAGALLPLCAVGCSESPTMRVVAQAATGSEVRLLVETSRVQEAFWEHDSTTSDVKGYLVTIDTSSGPLAQRSHVYGPLYGVPNARSTASVKAGAAFTDEDAEAARATPHCTFDADGQLVRYRTDAARHRTLFDRFDLAHAAWKDATAYPAIEDGAGSASTYRAFSTSGQYVLVDQDQRVRLFDRYTGKAQDNPWLTARFADVQSKADAAYWYAWFTDDLNHVVVRRDLDPKRHLWADRPDPALADVSWDAGTLSPEEYFRAAYLVDGQYLVLSTDPAAARLRRRDGTVAYQSPKDSGGHWVVPITAGDALATWHLPDQGKIVFFILGIDSFNEVADSDIVGQRKIRVTIWDYRHGTVYNDTLPIIDLFRQDGGGYVARSEPTPVR